MAFSPSGVRCPSRASTADPSSGRSAAAGEPYAEEAMAFTRANCLQRDVEIEVRAWRARQLCTCLRPSSIDLSYAEEAMAFARASCLQRDVRIEVRLAS